MGVGSRVFAFLALASAGCGDDDEPVDAARDALVDRAEPPVTIELEAPMPPAMAELPDLRPCLPGWAETTTASDVHVCAPFGGVPRRTCEGATMQVPSSSECDPVGPPCPSGAFPDDAPIDALFVQAGAASGGGTRTAPFATIGEAIAVASAGDVVVVGKGEYQENVLIERAIELRGACAAETRIIGQGEEPAISIEGASTDPVVLRSLLLSSTTGFVIRARDVPLELEGVVVDANTATVYADTLQARDVLVRGGELGSSVGCDDCQLEDVVLDRTSEVGLVSNVGTSELRNVVMIGAGPGNHIALGLSGTASARVVGLVSIGATALFASQTARYDADVVYVAEYPMVASAVGSGSGKVARAWASGSTGERITALGESTIEVVHSVFERAALDRLQTTRSSIYAVEGTVVLDHVVVDDSTDIGIAATMGGTIRGTDVVVRDIHSGPLGDTGHGAIATFATIDLTRARFERCDGPALLAYGTGARLALHDVDVVGGADEPRRGLGLAAIFGATAEVARVRVETASNVGVLAGGGGARVSGTDVVVRDTQPDRGAAGIGRAVAAESGAHIDIERAELTMSREHAVVAIAGSQVALRETRVIDVGMRQCAATSCDDRAFGVAVGSYASEVSLEGFDVRRASLCAVHFGDGATVSLRRGLIADSAIGVCADRDDVDLSALEDDVRYFRNGTNLDARRLPVPSPVPPVSVPEL